jgi:hypothetical protein
MTFTGGGGGVETSCHTINSRKKYVVGDWKHRYTISVTVMGIVHIKMNIMLLARGYCSVCVVNIECSCPASVWYSCWGTVCAMTGLWHRVFSSPANGVTDKELTLLRVTSLGPFCGGKTPSFFSLRYYMKMCVQHYTLIPLLPREVIPVTTISLAHCVIPRAAVVAFSPARSLELCSAFVVFMSVAQLQRSELRG